MKKILLWAVAVLIATTFTQCGNKAQQSAEVSVEETESNVAGDENVMVYGICGEASAMNTLQLITDTGDTLNLSIENAKEENQVFGGYSVGDKMAVYMKKDSVNWIKRTKKNVVQRLVLEIVQKKFVHTTILKTV